MREFVKNGAFFLDHGEIYFKYGYAGAQKFIRDFIGGNGVEVLIFAAESSSFHFPPDFFLGLRPGIFTVMMAGDTVYYYDSRDKYYAGAMDLFAIYDSFDTVLAFRRAGGDALLLLSAYDRTKYFRSEDRTKTIDVSFVGGFAGRKDRAEYVDYLLKNGIDVRLFGYGAPGGQVSLEQMVEIFNKSRINLNFTGATAASHLTRTNPVPPGAKQLKGRTIEAALCGSFVLSEYAPHIEKMLKPGEEMEVFATKEELLEKIKFYLSHGQERELIAERGYRRAIAEYDISLVIPKFLEEIALRIKNKRSGGFSAPPDPVFNRNFASYRMLCAIKFFKRLQFAFALEELALLLRTGPPDTSHFYTFFIEEIADKFPRTKAFFKNVARRILNRYNIRPGK